MSRASRRRDRACWSCRGRDSTYRSIPDNGGRGHAYGLELFLQRRPSAATRLSGWISYSLGVSKQDNPREPLHYRDVDQRHTLDLVGRLGLTRRSWLDVRYSYGSGFPWTPVARDPDGEPLFDAGGNVIREPVNSRRHPGYRRLVSYMLPMMPFFGLRLGH